ncbi:MAG: hypothetical protein LBT93_05870 [Treponema sp.]|nr:hypothetical protein [Treponema sp.]
MLYFCLGALFLCFIPETGLFGQEEDYRLEEDGGFVQILRWQGQENSLDYEVEIERRQGNGWETVLTERTGEAFYEVSLAAGTYRYRVRAYDIFEKPGEKAEWVQFEVLLAEQPELLRVAPQVFYPDTENRWNITLWGRNLVEGLEVYLQNRGEGEDPIRADAVRVENSGQEARADFDPGRLREGEYTVVVVNPGGLTSGEETLRILWSKPPDVPISAEYTPPVPRYGRINELFGTPFFPLEFYTQVQLIPHKWNRGAFGIEFEAFRYQFRIKKEFYEVQDQLTGGAIYGSYQWWFLTRSGSVNLRAGGGFYSLLDYQFIYPKDNTESLAVLIPVVSVGVSLQWIILRSFFMIGGVDFTRFFTADAPFPGYVRPFFGTGCRF